MADNLSSTPLADDALDNLATRIRGANQSSPELREEISRAVGLFLARQPAGLESVDHSAELEELLGSAWAAEIRAAQAAYAEQRGQLCMDGPEQGKHAGADPVMLFNGQFVLSVTDVRINGAGMDFAFTRTYKNQAYGPGPLGANWDHCWNLWLREEGDSLVRSSGELREDRYVRHQVHPYWVPPPGYHDTITADGDSYVLRTPGAVRFAYEREGAGRHRVRRIEDRNGNYLAFGYDDQGRLARVEINSPDRWVVVGYDTQDRITTVRAYPVTYRDQLGGSRVVSRVWRYTYDDFGDLVAATTPGTADHPAGCTTRYEYSSPSWSGELAHNLVRVWDPVGNLYLENEYGTQRGTLAYNRVVRQREGDGEYVFEYGDVLPENAWDDPWGYRPEEQPSARTVVVQRNGHPVEHIYNRLGNLIVRCEVLIEGCQRRELIYRYRYNRDGALVASLTPEGRVVQHAYGRDDYYDRPLGAGDPATEPWLDPNLTASERRTFGNQFATVRRASLFRREMLDLARGLYGDIFPSIWATSPADAVIKFTYEPVANQLATVSDPRHTASADPRHPESAAYRRHLTRHEYDATPRANLVRIRHPDTMFPEPLPDGTTGLSGTTSEFFAYDARGRLLVARDEEGHERRLVYFSGGPRDGYLRREIRDAAGLGLRTAYRVDEAGQVRVQLNPRGLRTRTFRNELGQVVRTVDGLGFQSRLRFDRNGLVVQQERDNLDDAGQRSSEGDEVRTYRYDGSDNLLRETIGGTDLAGHHVTRYRYDAAGVRVATMLPRGNRATATYDERRLPRTRTRGAGSRLASTQRIGYDGDGRATSTIDGRGNVTRTRHDPLGRVIAVLDALGGLRQYEYDKAGNRTVERFLAPRQDGTHDLLTRSSWTYDERGNQIEATAWAFPAPIRTGAASAAPDAEFDAELAQGRVTALTTCYFYDRARRLVRVVDPAGRATVYGYDGANRRILDRDALGNPTRTTYDANGNPVRVDRHELVRNPATGAVTGEEVFSTLREYDTLDRLVAVTDGLGNRTRYTYDSRGNQCSVTDPLGNVRRSVYDVFGRRAQSVVEMTETGLGGGPRLPDLVTQFFYDANGNLTEVRDARGNRTLFEFDPLDRHHRTIWPDGSDACLEYDADDHVVARVDGNGLRINHTVDALGRVERVDLDATGLRQEYPYPAGAETFEACVFDGLGRIMEQRNDTCRIETGFDSLGRPAEERVWFTTPAGPAGPLVLGRGFDAASNRVRLRYPNGRDLRWYHDALHRPVRIEQRATGTAYPGSAMWPTIYDVARFAYRGLRLSDAVFANGAGYRHAHDGAGRVIAVRHSSRGATLLATQHLYDGAGNRRYRRDAPAPASLPGGEAYSYDSASRLGRAERRQITAVDPANFAPPAQPLPAEELDGQRAIDAAIGSLAHDPAQATWRYDATGNRIEEYSDGQLPVLYTPNPLDQYANVGAAAYRYDRNGNLLDDGTLQYRYNYRNRLSQVVDKATGVELLRLAYDPVGRLAVIREGGTGPWTHLISDGRDAVEEYRGSVLVASYVNGNGPDQRIQAAAAGREWWYHADLLRSTRLLTTGTGTVEARYDDGPFGSPGPPGVTGAHPNRYRFAGKRLLTAGLYDARARTYAPALGRFLQRDPAGMVDGTNPYPYSGNNPVTFIDPLGTDKQGVLQSEEEEPLNLEELFALWSRMYDETLNGTTGEPHLPLPQTGGQGLVTTWDTLMRTAYLQEVKEASAAAIAEVQAARAAGDLTKAEQAAKRVSDLRNLLRAETQGVLTPGGNLMSRALEQPRDWATVFNKYGGTRSFDTFEAIAEASGRSAPSVTRLATFGRYAGPIGLVVGGGVGVYEVARAPEAEQTRVAVRETGGLAGGVLGSTAGTAGGTLLAGGIAAFFGLSGPPGWLVLVLGIGGGATGGYFGTEAGRGVSERAYDTALEAYVEMERSIYQLYGVPFF